MPLRTKKGHHLSGARNGASGPTLHHLCCVAFGPCDYVAYSNISCHKIIRHGLKVTLEVVLIDEIPSNFYFLLYGFLNYLTFFTMSVHYFHIY